MNSLFIEESPISVYPTTAKLIGLNESIFVQQLYYWVRRSKHQYDDKLWIYNTYEKWAEQFPFWSVRTIKRIVSSLRDQGLIETTDKYNKLSIDKTLWYTINFDKAQELASSAKSDGTTIVTEWHDESDNLSPPTVTEWHDESDNLSPPIPETTTETTTKTTTEDTATQLAKHEKELTSQQEMFGAICEAIGWDYKTLSKEDRGQVAQVGGILTKSNYAKEDVRQFMIDIWFHDWRWENHGQRPTLKQLRQEIGKIRAGIPEGVTRNKDKPLVYDRNQAAFDEVRRMLKEKK